MPGMLSMKTSVTSCLRDCLLLLWLFTQWLLVFFQYSKSVALKPYCASEALEHRFVYSTQNFLIQEVRDRALEFAFLTNADSDAASWRATLLEIDIFHALTCFFPLFYTLLLREFTYSHASSVICIWMTPPRSIQRPNESPSWTAHPGWLLPTKHLTFVHIFYRLLKSVYQV